MGQRAKVGRREFLRFGAAGAAVVTWPVPGWAQAKRAIKIGYVSPQTGALAGFGEADSFVVGGVRKAIGKGLEIRGATHPVEILVRDSQSDPNRAAEVASRLILSD
jgi:branched-chain amino acid transport system substrate-binding protein